jgi:hypothetical protein
MASTSPAADRPRPRARLIGPWTLIAFTALIAAALISLFPRTELLDLITRSERTAPLTDTYLTNLHALQPDNPHSALLLARTRLAQGRNREALALVAVHARSADPAIRREAVKLRLDILRDEHARSGKDAAAASEPRHLGIAARPARAAR